MFWEDFGKNCHPSDLSLRVVLVNVDSSFDRMQMLADINADSLFRGSRLFLFEMCVLKTASSMTRHWFSISQIRCQWTSVRRCVLRKRNASSRSSWRKKRRWPVKIGSSISSMVSRYESDGCSFSNTWITSLSWHGIHTHSMHRKNRFETRWRNADAACSYGIFKT